MTELYVKLHLFLARHRWAVLLLVAGFAVGAVLMGRRLKLNEDFTDMLPMSVPAIAEQVEALKHIRQADRLYVDVQSAAPDPARLAEAADQTCEALRGIPELGDFRYNVDAAEMKGVYEELQAQLPTMLASNELHELEARLEPAALEKRLAWLKKAMSQPQGLMFKDVAQTDPAGISDAVTVRLRALQAGAGDARIVDGRITSADGRHVLISAAPAFRSSDFRKSAALMDAVLKAARSVEARHPDGLVRIAVTGAHRSALDNATTIRRDSERTSAIAAVAVIVLMLTAYRRRWLALLGLLPTVFGALGAVVVFYLTGDPVSAVALGCGSILIGVTVDYGICVLYRVDDFPPADRGQLARAVAQLVPALTFGALTTMAAFFVMFVSPVSGHRQLGLFSAVGIALAAFFALVILPLFIPAGGGGHPACRRGPASRRPDQADMVTEPENGRETSSDSAPPSAARDALAPRQAGCPPPQPTRAALPLTFFMQRLFDWRARHARQVLPLLLLFTGLCVAGVWRLRFEGDFARLNGVTAETRRDEETVREVWGKALSLTTVVAGGATREEALRKNERICAVLRTLQEKQAVESFSSIAPLLPSEQGRAANLRDWRAYWTENRLVSFSNSLTRAAANLGFRAGAFQPFLERLCASATAQSYPETGRDALPRVQADRQVGPTGLGESTTPPQVASAGTNTALGRFAAEYLSEKDGRHIATTLVKTKDRGSYQQLREAVLTRVPDALFLNKTALSDEITRIARRALPVFSLMVAVLNALLLYLLLGRVVLVLITLLPMAVGVFWTLGSLGLLGLPIDMSNFIFVIFVIGVGGDYSLFMVLAELEPLRGCQERTASTGAAVTVCSLTTLFGVGVLVLARHPALFSVGLTALLGISFSLLATLFLVPPCMKWLAARWRAKAAALSERNSIGDPARPHPQGGARHSVRAVGNNLDASVGNRGAQGTGAPHLDPKGISRRRREVGLLYRYHEPYVTQFVFWKMKTDPLFAAAEAAAPARGEILDLGCGYGIVAHWLTLRAPERRVRGVDFDAAKIQVARATAELNPRVSFERRDLLEWGEYPSCDCALLCDVLHYFPRELKAEVLRKVFAALRPGGRLILRDACASGSPGHGRVAWSEKWAVRFGQNRTRYGLHFENEETHLALLREAGFVEIEVRRDGGLGSNAMFVATKFGA